QPMATQILAVEPLFSSESLDRLASIQIVSDRAVVGVQFVDVPEADMAALPALTTHSREWLLPLGSDANLDVWTRVGLFNGSPTSVAVSVEGFDALNNHLGIIASGTLPPNGSDWLETANLRGVIPAGTVLLRVTADQPVSAWELFGVTNGAGMA